VGHSRYSPFSMSGPLALMEVTSQLSPLGGRLIEKRASQVVVDGLLVEITSRYSAATLRSLNC
jgi:hypothetical protein